MANIPDELDCFCNSCKNFERIQKGNAMFGWCLIHNQAVDAKKQFERFVASYYSFDLGRMVIERKTKFQLKEDCWISRKEKCE